MIKREQNIKLKWNVPNRKKIESTMKKWICILICKYISNGTDGWEETQFVIFWLHYPEKCKTKYAVYSCGVTRAIKSTPKLIHFERRTGVIFTYLLVLFGSRLSSCMLSRITHRCMTRIESIFLARFSHSSCFFFFFDFFQILFYSYIFFVLLHYFDLLLWQIQYCALECSITRIQNASDSMYDEWIEKQQKKYSLCKCCFVMNRKKQEKIQKWR